MFNDCFNLKIGWMVSMYIPVVPLGFDMAYPAELQNLCDRTADADRAFLMVWFHKMFVCHAQDLRGDLLKQGLK